MRAMVLSTLGAVGIASFGYGMMPGGEVYELPVSEVETKLRRMDIPDELNLQNDTSEIVVGGDPGSKVTWELRDRGQPVAWVAAEMAAVDPTHTRVEVAFTLSEHGTHGETATLLNKQKFVKAIGEMAIGEAIDSTLEDRAYDRDAVGRHALAYAALHPQEVAQFRGAFDDIEEAARRARAAGRDSTDYEAARDAKRPEVGVAAREREANRAMEAASAPMVDPSRRRSLGDY